MRFGSAAILTNGSMSASTITTQGLDLQQEWIYSIQANWAQATGQLGSGAGTLKLQISNDNVPLPQMSGPVAGVDPAANVKNWTDYSGSSYAVVASTGSSSFMWNVLYPGYRWVRMVYTSSSGSGVMSASYFGKGN